jgi:hypothetical protein
MPKLLWLLWLFLLNAIEMNIITWLFLPNTTEIDTVNWPFLPNTFYQGGL